MKRGVIWISAILYIGIGVVILGILLTAMLPLIGGLRDRNTFSETKGMMATLDATIRTVATEGPGSQRQLSPLVVNAGKLFVSQANDTITWSMETGADILELNTLIHEGPLELLAVPSKIAGKNVVSIRLDYANKYDLKLVSKYQPPFFGRYQAVIKHSGNFTSSNLPMIEVHIR